MHTTPELADHESVGTSERATEKCKQLRRRRRRISTFSSPPTP